MRRARCGGASGVDDGCSLKSKHPTDPVCDCIWMFRIHCHRQRSRILAMVVRTLPSTRLSVIDYMYAMDSAFVSSGQLSSLKMPS